MGPDKSNTSIVKNRKWRVIVAIILADVIAIILSIKLSFWILDKLTNYLFISFDYYEISSGFYLYIIVIPLWLMIFYMLKCYNYLKDQPHRSLLLTISGVTIATVSLIVFSFLFNIQFTRSLILTLWIVSIIVISPIHFLYTNLLKWIKGRKIGVEKISIIGSGNEAQAIGEMLNGTRSTRNGFCGYIVNSTSHDKLSSEIIGSVSNIEDVIEKYNINRIIVCISSLSHNELLNIAYSCEKKDISLDIIPDLLNILPAKVNVFMQGNIPLIRIRKIGVSYTAQFVKRLIDILVVVIGGILLFPFMAIIALLIKIDSPGPIIYKQKRIGQGGKPFYFYKFRSMHMNTEQLREVLQKEHNVDERLFKIKNDPRITRFGRFLRKTSIDELPQILNVLKGDMTLVGPRPLPRADIMNAKDNPESQYWFKQRTNVLPGITGLWQIRGRSELSFQKMVRLDIYYVLNWSLKLDLEILIKTIPAILSGRGAY